MDGEMIKSASRYVGTGTILRHMESSARISSYLEKEAVVGRVLKKMFSMPTSLYRGAGRKIPQALREGLVGDPAEAGKRFLRPLEGLQSGWRGMSGSAGRERELTKMIQHRGHLKGLLNRPDIGADAKKIQKAIDDASKGIEKFKKRTTHLAPGAEVGWREALKGGPKGVAEGLSRSGWTGSGRVTKYVPLGQKSLMAGFAASEVPGIVNAPKSTRTGEGGSLERLGGALGGTAGWVAGSGRIGFIPSLALWMAAEKAGKGAGRLADRLRAGAGLREAATAPSPREAREQLAKIYQTYGG